MKKSDFYKEQKVAVYVDGQQFTFDSFADMLGNFNDVSNSEQWAIVHHSGNGESSVFVAHRFDTVGKIVESGMEKEEAEKYADELNEYFGIVEEFGVELL